MLTEERSIELGVLLYNPAERYTLLVALGSIAILSIPKNVHSDFEAQSVNGFQLLVASIHR
jgi:hypothetical protein